MRALSHGGVVHAQIAADGPHDHLTGVDTDADLRFDPVGSPHLLGIALDSGLHVEGGVAGAHGVIFVGQWRPEQGHDSVASHLADGALVAMDGVHHSFDHGVEQLVGLFRIAIGEHFQRTLEVGKENGDLLSLAFQRRAGDQNFLGEVLRRICLGRSRSVLGFWLRRLREWRPALTTEPVVGRTGRATGSTGGSERRAALAAKSHVGWVVMLAARALHTIYLLVWQASVRSRGGSRRGVFAPENC